MEDNTPVPIPGTAFFIQTEREGGRFNAHLVDAAGQSIRPDITVNNCSSHTNAMILMAFRAGRVS